jgi:Ca2+-binding EF-hand superfamily protein
MKKTVLSATLISATLFLVAGRAEAPKSTTAPVMDANQAELLQRYDTNHDGKLDEAELAAAHEAMLKSGGGAGERAGKLRALLLKRFDQNGDGRLDETERATMRSYFLARFDKDGDGRLDDTERAAMRAELKAEYQAGKLKK